MTARRLSARGPHRVISPVLTAAAAAAAGGYISRVDPGRPGHYPGCPFLALTGHYCPGCGTLRAIHALAHGQISEAFGYNALTMALLPVLACLWLRWLLTALGRWPGRPSRPAAAHPAWTWGFAVLVGVFWLVRNLPFGHMLAPVGIS